MSADRKAKHLVQSTKAHIEFLVAFQEAATVEPTDPADKISKGTTCCEIMPNFE